MAMLNYESAHGSLPPAAVCGRDGRPLLSWRVLILPYLDQADRYKQFKLDESWDSPHNFALLGRMPRTYAPLTGRPSPEPHVTYYQVFTGPGTVFEGSTGLRRDTILAEVASTFLIVEAG